MQATRCDGWVNGCTGAGEHRTVTGGHLCENCHDNRVADEAACMAGNGTPPPLAFTSWWRRLLGRAA
ncbi:MAG TPA: hypothetical protein VGL39_06785 [Jatrophihabitantaceae bacterium]|jgi:hypothetical protein